MLSFPFLVGENVSLECDLAKPIRLIEVIYGQTHKPVYVKIAYENSISLFISVEMNEVRERFEIGRLVIEDFIEEDILKNKNILLKFDEFYVKSCSKMVYVGEWGRAECGLKFENIDGEQFYIVSGDYPYSVSLIGDRFEALGLVPEFALNEYHYEEIGPI
ncbi:hypothetical protein [Agrobacterium vitis]|uniref:hypothetical protein n=1 Tax=Agrobacterium vitis TaxID=373 RepID=UPI0015737B21|nr:hypothetical protein [Agrobacterium vitis]NSZ16436.1 hypothetical protein [Agrobacterium vitis]QZO05209.1 hypothetical protein K4831_06735 [Agrobacterium vitis]UJL87356.1 hypothetical protein AVF2S5_05070 [Agrobacterium vitis]